MALVFDPYSLAALATRLGLVFTGLGYRMQARSFADWREAAIVLLMGTRLRRLRDRVLRLADRLRRGMPLRPAGAGVPAPAGRLPSLPPLPPAYRMPNDPGWLAQFLPGAEEDVEELQALLAEPGLATLLAVAPQLKRTLRAACRMLGLKPPAAAAATRRSQAEAGTEAGASADAGVSGASGRRAGPRVWPWQREPGAPPDAPPKKGWVLPTLDLRPPTLDVNAPTCWRARA